jgi:hypothetical protein
VNAELTPERKPFKEWLDGAPACMLGAQVAGAMPSFDKPKFVALATANPVSAPCTKASGAVLR